MWILQAQYSQGSSLLKQTQTPLPVLFKISPLKETELSLLHFTFFSDFEETTCIDNFYIANICLQNHQYSLTIRHDCFG